MSGGSTERAPATSNRVGTSFRAMLFLISTIGAPCLILLVTTRTFDWLSAFTAFSLAEFT